jgi:putative isomerase
MIGLTKGHFMDSRSPFTKYRYGSTVLVAASMLLGLLNTSPTSRSAAQEVHSTPEVTTLQKSRWAEQKTAPSRMSPNYQKVQERLAQGWNTWDVHSVMTHVLLPAGLAIHVGLKHNTTLWGDAFLSDALIGRMGQGAEEIFPGAHAWHGSYTDLRGSWKGHRWEVQSAHDGKDLVLLVQPLESKPLSALPPTVIFSVDFLWNRPGTFERHDDHIAANSLAGAIPIYCTCGSAETRRDSPLGHFHEPMTAPIASPYFAIDFTQAVGVSTGKPRSLQDIETIINHQRELYRQSIAAARETGPTLDAIQTTIGWDTIYDPDGLRVISPVSRLWSVGWGGYVLFDWDTFFAATLAAVGDRDLAYANAIEILRESTEQGFVPNYARAGGWKSSDRSEPPVGAITVLGLYQTFHDRWFLEEAFEPLLRWNRWWAEHRDIQGYLTWGSDGANAPENLDDHSRGTRDGAVLESGLDNSPMYDNVVYNPQSHLLEFADVGLMSLYIADCDALASIAEILQRPQQSKELRERSARYRAKVQTLWNSDAGIFLNKDLHTGEFSMRLSPTNFYPLLARVATPTQAQIMTQKHLLNPEEFWGSWVIPSIARNDPAFHDQNYWRGRIWGPMNYLLYLGLRNYDDAKVRKDFAEKSFSLFRKEWKEQGHVHENYNGISGTGDDVTSSDRFYHWGALLGYVEYMEQTQSSAPRESTQ